MTRIAQHLSSRSTSSVSKGAKGAKGAKGGFFNSKNVPSERVEHVILSESNKKAVERVLKSFNPTVYQKLIDEEGNIPQKILLSGPPGTGKTVLARAIAGSLGYSFAEYSGASMMSRFIGQSAENIRGIFKEAKHNQPCVIFIDEIDSIAKKRVGGLGDGGRAYDSVLTELLSELNHIKGHKVLFVCATNTPDLLDDAFKRKGRMDLHLKINLPDVEARKEIIEIHTQGCFRIDNLDKLAKLTEGLSGADIEGILKEVKSFCILEEREEVTQKEVEEAIAKHKSENIPKVQATPHYNLFNMVLDKGMGRNRGRNRMRFQFQESSRRDLHLMNKERSSSPGPSHNKFIK